MEIKFPGTLVKIIVRIKIDKLLQQHLKFIEADSTAVKWLICGNSPNNQHFHYISVTNRPVSLSNIVTQSINKKIEKQIKDI